MQHERNIEQDNQLAHALFLSKPPSPVQAKPPAKRPALTAGERSARQQRDRRKARFTAAAKLSADAGYPLTCQMTLTWHALQYGELREGNCLDMPETKILSRLWRNLKHLAKTNGLPFIAMRAPENDAHKGLHVHIALHLPEHLRPALIRVVEKLTGAPDGQEKFKCAERNRGYFARSGCKGWLLQENRRVGAGGEIGLATYLTKSARRPESTSRYYLSGDLSRIVASAHKTAPEGAWERDNGQS
jgi:hypothetical protein